MTLNSSTLNSTNLIKIFIRILEYLSTRINKNIQLNMISKNINRMGRQIKRMLVNLNIAMGTKIVAKLIRTYSHQSSY